MACELHLNDIGTIFEIAITDCDGAPIDITSAQTLKIMFEKPDCTVVTKTATMYGPGTDGIVRYTIISGDLNQVGDWRVQAEVAFTVNKYTSTSTGFTVFPNLVTE